VPVTNIATAGLTQQHSGKEFTHAGHTSTSNSATKCFTHSSIGAPIRLSEDQRHQTHAAANHCKDLHDVEALKPTDLKRTLHCSLQICTVMMARTQGDQAGQESESQCSEGHTTSSFFHNQQIPDAVCGAEMLRQGCTTCTPDNKTLNAVKAFQLHALAMHLPTKVAPHRLPAASHRCNASCLLHGILCCCWCPTITCCCCC
jgi:hypothetical protein